MPTIKSTINYDRFEQHEVNRRVSGSISLELSMEKYGWIDAYPMHVVRNGGVKLKIKTGHHRFATAKKLGIPVKYVICDDGGVSIHELENSTKLWTLRDYLDSYVQLKMHDYIEVKKYHEKTGIPLTLTMSVMGGNSAGSNNMTPMFKAGTYKIAKNQKHANDIKYIVLFMSDLNIPNVTTAKFVAALSKILRVEQFSIDRFIKKIKSHRSFFKTRTSIENYMDEIEKIYNRQSKDKMPLRFMAEEEAKKRKIGGLKYAD